MKSFSLATHSFVCILAVLSNCDVSAADRDQWIGETRNKARIEFRRSRSNNTWQQLINGSTDVLTQQSSDQERTILRNRLGETIVILRTEAVKFSRNNRVVSKFRGGWNEGVDGFPGVPFGYNYVGRGNRGGVPINEFDRAAQRHDIGYETEPLKFMDGRTDARFVFDSARAAANPRNGMGVEHRAYAAGGALLFSLKPAIYHSKPVFGKRIPIPDPGLNPTAPLSSMHLYAGEQGWNRVVKPGAKWTYKKAIKPVGNSIGKATKKGFNGMKKGLKKFNPF